MQLLCGCSLAHWIAALLLVFRGRAGSPTAQQETRPQLRWGQTNTTVYITAEVPRLQACKSEAASAFDGGLESDHFWLTASCDIAQDAGASRWRIEFREHIELEGSRVERQSSGGLLLVLRKRFTHRWDRLLQEDGAAFVSKDWKREDPQLPEEDEVELPRARNIRQFSFAELTEYSARSIVVAALRFPWCTQCEEKDKAFVKATKLLGGKMAFSDIVFGVLDLREHKAAVTKWGIGCSKECALHVFKPDEPIEEPYLVEMQLLYEMDEMAMMTDPMAGAPGHSSKGQNVKPNFERLEQDLNRLMPPALTTVETAGELADFRKSWFNTVLGFGVNSTEFRRAARRLRGEAAFAVTSQPALLNSTADGSAGTARIELWASEATPSRSPVIFDGQALPLDATDLSLFVMVNIQPLFQNYSWDLKSKFEGIGLPIAVLWVNHSDVNSSNITHKALKAFESVCDRRRGRNASEHVLCCLQDESYSYYQREYGSHEPYPYPFFGLTKKLGYGEGDRYGYPFKEPVNVTNRKFFGSTKSAIREMNGWISRVMAGKVPPSHESALLPAQPLAKRGEVQEICWKTFQKEVNRSTADILMELYDDQRKDSHVRGATMRMVASAVKDYPSLKVVRMETSQNYVPPIFGRKQFSKDTEYYWVPPSISTSEWAPEPPVKYKGQEPVTPERLIRFFKKHTLAHWSLPEALEIVSDLSPEVMGQAQVEQREDDRAADEKQKMISKMMTTLKKEKGLVDVGEMMGLKKAADKMGGNKETDKKKKGKASSKTGAESEKTGTKSSLKTPPQATKPQIPDPVAEELRRKEKREKLKIEEEKFKKLEKKEKEKKKQRREADKKRKERKKKEEADAKAREAKELERKREKAKRQAEERAMAPTTPFFSWGQLRDQVQVSVSVPKINPDALNVTLTDDTVAVHARDGRNRSFILHFELREFIVLTNSTWELRYSAENPLNPKPDGVMLHLGKANAHRWDQLAQNHSLIKPFMRKDWVHLDDEGLEEEEDVDLPSGAGIRKVTAEKLRELTLKNTMVVAALRYPWCNKCAEKDKYFGKAGRTLKDKEHLGATVFAVVDIREEKHLGRRHNMSCDDQCKLLIFKQDEPDEPYIVPGRRYTEEIQIDCYKHLLSVVSVVEDKDMFDRVTSAFDTAIVGFFKGSKEEDTWYPRFKAVARQLRGHALFGAVFGGREPREFGIDHDATPSIVAGDDDAARPLILLFKPKEQRHVEFTGNLTLDKLTRFSRVLSLPLLSTYEFEQRQKYQELKVPLGMMWLNGEQPDCEENIHAKSIARRLAIRFSGHLVFVLLNGTRDGLLMRPMALDPRRVPTFGLEASDEADSEKFGFDTGARNKEELSTFWKEENRTYEKLETFCASFLDGTLEQSHESAELPPTYYWPGPGVVHEVVWKSFRESVYRSDHDILLELYSPMRPQHRTYWTVLDLVAEALQNLSSVKIVRMDTANNYVLPEFGLKDKEKASSFYFIRAGPERQRQPKRFGGKAGKAEALPAKLIQFVHRETRDHSEWDVAERVSFANREAQRRIKRLRALEKDYEKKMQEEWMQKEMEEFERYKRLGKFDNLPPMG